MRVISQNSAYGHFGGQDQGHLDQMVPRWPRLVKAVLKRANFFYPNRDITSTKGIMAKHTVSRKK